MRIVKSVLLLLAMTASPLYAQVEWSPPVMISGHCQIFTPKILSIGDALHIISTSYREGQWGIDYFGSTDKGVTWPLFTRIATGFPGVTPSPSILEYNSKLLILWSDGNMTNSKITSRISMDYGVTWEPQREVIGYDWEHDIFWITASNTDSIVNIMLSGSRYDDYDKFIFNIRSTDFGQTWSAPNQIIDPACTYDIPDQVSYGNYVHLVWSGKFPGDSIPILYYTKSTDDGTTWGVSIPLYSRRWSGIPSIAVNQYGKLEVLWIDQNYNLHNNTYLKLSNDSGNTWTPTIQLTTDSTSWATGDIVLDHDIIYAAWEGDYQSERIGHDIIFNKGYNDGQIWEGQYWLDRNFVGVSRFPALVVSKRRINAVWSDCGINPDSTIGLYFSYWPYYGPDAIDDDVIIPNTLSLSAYPNPFNSSTTLSLGSAEDAEISIYDITGRMIMTLKAESGKAVWNAAGFSSGVYFARVRTEEKAESIKLILLK